MVRKDYCVIGLGRFGAAVIDTLVKEGHTVMVLDEDREKINAFSSIVSYAATLDSTDDSALKAVGVKDMDHVIVAIGNDIESSIMTCALLLDLGVKNITAKAVSSRHERVLRALGVKNVIRPEIQSGHRTAIQIVHSFFGEFVTISEDHSIVQIELTNDQITNRALKDVNLRKEGVNVVAVNRSGDLFIPSGEDKLKLGDILIIIGQNADIARLENFLNTNSSVSNSNFNK